MMRRREFVTSAGAVVAAVGLLPGAVVAAAADVLDIEAVRFTGGWRRSKFLALLRQTFYIHTENDGVVLVRLDEVRDRKSKSNIATGLEQFSLIFHGPPLPALPAASYEVEHWLAGRILLYLEPAGPPSVYRADFSLLR